MTRKFSKVALYRQARRAVAVGLVINLALAVVKLTGGLVAQSLALISDGVNSLGDSLTSVVVLFGLWFAERPADADHPYGHSRAEAIAAANVALFVIFSALVVGWTAITHIGVTHALPPAWALWIAAANVVLKESLYRYKLRVGRHTGSMAVIANAWDHRADAFCSLAVLVGLGIVRWAGPRYIWADEAAAVVVVATIVWSASQLFWHCTSELMDPQADAALVGAARDVAEEVPGVRGVETLWMRKSGLEYLIDIHVEVDSNLTVAEGHQIGHAAKDALLEQFSVVRDVLVHIEPFPHVHVHSPGPAQSTRDRSEGADQ